MANTLVAAHFVNELNARARVGLVERMAGAMGSFVRSGDGYPEMWISADIRACQSEGELIRAAWRWWSTEA